MNDIYPVVLFVYKRPQRLPDFLHQINDSGTRKLYIFADAPRNDSDRKLTEEINGIVTKFGSANPQIQIEAVYREANLGLKKNIVTGLNTVFSQEKAAIILEDDCLPAPDFFHFASEMLSKYEEEEKVMSITGTSVGKISEFSYDFCRYQHCWGWATWSRAWNKYDPRLSQFKPVTWKQLSSRIWPDKFMRLYWYLMLSMTKAGWLDTWDFQWSYAHFIHQGLAIYPKVNLISNIGFDSAATNTKQSSPVASAGLEEMAWPLTHPPVVRENAELTELMEKKFYNNPIAILGMLRQYFYWKVSRYAPRT